MEETKPLSVVILAAGSSSRFFPFSTKKHKACTKIFGKTVLEHTLCSVKNTGVKNVVIVQGESSEIENQIGNGANFNLSIKYVTQKEPTGMGNAILLAKKHIPDNFFVISAHRMDFAAHAQNILHARKKDQDLVVLVKSERDVSDYGVISLHDKKITSIVEKPKKGKEPSEYRVLGIYLLTKQFLTHLKDSKNEHYSLESAISTFSKHADIYPAFTDEKLFSLKYPWDLFDLSKYIFKTTYKPSISKEATIAKSANISGNVSIGKGSKIMESATIKGPVYIGENVTIGNNTLIRNESVIEDDCTVGANAEVNNTIIQEGTHIHSGFFGNSIIGKNGRIGAGFTTGNKRLDRKEVCVVVKGKKVNTKKTSFGAIIGDDVKIGINCSTMPGVVVGSSAVIGPSTTIEKNVEENVLYYTKFKEIVKKKNK